LTLACIPQDGWSESETHYASVHGIDRLRPITRVLDVERKPIPGLFAVGNDAASIFGGSYPGAGATLGPAMTFGYICGKHLAENRKADPAAS
jgi:succinate dehydrogenase/fumarate reductase flavoprotein subunit